MRRIIALAVLPLLGLSACGFNEGLIIEDMEGRVIIPRAAATRVMPNGEEITDVKLIGPVYLGLYAEVRNDILQFPHPEVGPSFSEDQVGNTYPYGGTSVGDIRYPCLEDLVCKVTAGRFLDYDEILDWFGTYFEDEVVDEQNRPVTTGEFIQQTCFERLRVTSDDEVRLIQSVDTNEDGTIDALDLEFVENADGDFEGDFKIWQQEFTDGFKLWGWMDAPARNDGRINTCNSSEGFYDGEYTSNYRGGRPYRELLNFPQDFLQEGDWVASDPHVYSAWDDDVVITMDFEVLE